jgi:diketogulonate reductase-like aldo/keto reductase
MPEEFGTKIMAWGPLAQGQFDIFTNSELKAIGVEHRKSISKASLNELVIYQKILKLLHEGQSRKK